MQQNPIHYSTPKEKKAIIKLQTWVKGKKDRKKYQVLRKRARYRKNVIMELINTEETYVRDLQLIFDKVSISIRVKVLSVLPARRIVSDEDLKKIFMNLPQVLNFNKEFLAVFKQSYENYWPYKVVFAEPNKLIKGFHFYFDYCNAYQGSCKMQDQLKESNAWQEFLGELRKANALKGMDLQSYLVKPVQRLPKYVLLYKDLLKHTDTDHPDYLNINKGLHDFQQVNEENNKNMDKFMSRLRLAEIENILHFTVNELQKDPDRLFRFEETLTLIEGGQNESSVLVYALTDMLIIMERKEENPKMIKTLFINPLSFVKDQQDSKYFSYLFQIVGRDDNVQFQAENNQSKQRMIGVFDQLIQELREIERKKEEKKTGQQADLEYPVQVVVVGTEERAYQSFQKHTVYITEISIHKIYLKIFVRYSEVKKLSEKITHGSLKKDYSGFKAMEFPTEQWITNHKTKVIEQRKIALESFLQLVLSSKATKNCKEVLNDLNLPLKFYELPKIYSEQTQKKYRVSNAAFQQQKTLDPKEQLRQLGIDITILQKSAGEVLKAYSEDKKSKKVPSTLLIPSNITKNKGTLPDSQKVDIFLPDGISIRLGISHDTRASEVVQSVAEEIKIHYFHDFRLYLKDQLQNYRLLDDDEVVSKVIKDESKNDGLIKGLFNKVEQALASSSGLSLHFRKYIFLPEFLEEHDFRTDPIRRRLLAFQILDYVRIQKFYLQFKDYCLYASLYYHVKYPQKLQGNIDTMPLDHIAEIVPEQIYKTNNEKEWIKNTRELLKILKHQIEQICSQNIAAKLQGADQEYGILTEPIEIVYQIIFNSIKTNRLAGIGVYHVETHQKTMQWMQKQKLEIYPNIYLGVQFEKLHYLTPSRKDVFKSFEFSKVQNIKSYPMQIIFGFENYKDDQLVRFNTYQSYEIKNLIEQYKNLQQFNKDFELGLTKR